MLVTQAAFQVVKFLKRLTRNLNTTVVATIHQPSVKVFELFDDLLILAYGDPVYFGTAGNLERHMNSLGYQVPPHETAAEFVLDLINADFADDPEVSVLLFGPHPSATLQWRGDGRARMHRPVRILGSKCDSAGGSCTCVTPRGYAVGCYPTAVPCAVV